MRHANPEKALEIADRTMEDFGKKVHTERWQSLDISERPEAEMVEIMHHSLIFPMKTLDLKYYQDQVEPNLPWADDHFQERVCGYPINPGTEWANWPWSTHADKHREEEMFNHNYMERYWPKLVNKVGFPTADRQEFVEALVGEEPGFDSDTLMPIRGLRHEYGDLGDVVNLLAFEPQTRQAYMPIWFPEDTGTTHSGRKPCTLGYHFIMRNNKLDIRYDIRSCDLFRHFRDDVYLTIRLVHWVLMECRKLNPEVWENIQLGDFVMHITSLHMFAGDYYVKFGKPAK